MDGIGGKSGKRVYLFDKLTFFQYDNTNDGGRSMRGIDPYFSPWLLEPIEPKPRKAQKKRLHVLVLNVIIILK